MVHAGVLHSMATREANNERVLRAVARHPGCSGRELLRHVRLNRQTVYRALRDLTSQGKVKCVVVHGWKYAFWPNG